MSVVLKDHDFDLLSVNTRVVSLATKRRGVIKALRKQNTHPTFPRHNEVEVLWDDHSPNTRMYHKDCVTLAFEEKP